jgi:hypothetical protein
MDLHAQVELPADGVADRLDDAHRLGDGLGRRQTLETTEKRDHPQRRIPVCDAVPRALGELLVRRATDDREDLDSVAALAAE